MWLNWKLRILKIRERTKYRVFFYENNRVLIREKTSFIKKAKKQDVTESKYGLNFDQNIFIFLINVKV